MQMNILGNYILLQLNFHFRLMDKKLSSAGIQNWLVRVLQSILDGQVKNRGTVNFCVWSSFVSLGLHWVRPIYCSIIWPRAASFHLLLLHIRCRGLNLRLLHSKHILCPHTMPLPLKMNILNLLLLLFLLNM